MKIAVATFALVCLCVASANAQSAQGAKEGAVKPVTLNANFQMSIPLIAAPRPPISPRRLRRPTPP